MPVNSRRAIDRFLARKRIAFIGISRKPSDFSRHVFRAFVERGYDVIPVHPNMTEVEGRRCYSRVANISPKPEAAVLMTSHGVSERVVRECADAGVEQVWLHRGAGKGAVSPGAVEAGRKAGMDVVAGECPFMFLCGDEFPHKIHGWIKKATFAYPK